MSCARKNGGYTLVAVSIIVLVASLLITSQVGTSTSVERVNQLKITQDALNEIENAINVFYRQNGYIPCPASRIDAINTASFGLSTNCATVGDSLPAYKEIGIGVDRVRIGVVPTKSLSISDKYALDGWGNRITYAVITDLATSSVLFTGYISATTRVINVQDAAAAINPTSPNHTAYALVSHGRDGSGARNFLGTSAPAACLVNQDNENCDDDAVFRFQPQNEAVGTASYFDDLVRWKTISGVKNIQIVSSGGAVATNGIAGLKVATFNTGAFNGDTSVAGCGTNCKVEGTWAPTLASSNPSISGITVFADRITAPAGRYIMRMSTPFCGVGRGVGLMYYPGSPINQIGRHFVSYSYENTVTGTHRCSRSTAIAYFTHDGVQEIRFGRYMDNLTPNAATYHFGISYQFNPLVSNNTNYFPEYEYVQVELWQLD